MNKPDSEIRYLERSEIDTNKWDHCIINAFNGLIYARSFYLDMMANKWSALVMGDYEMVMPLTWNKKFGIKYLYQPYFTKTLGVFGESSLPIDISSFINRIPKFFKFWDIDLNENNLIPYGVKNNILKQYTRTNHLLSLYKDPSQIRSKYKRLANRMLKKASDNQLKIFRGENPDSIIKLYARDYANRQPYITGPIYQNLIACTDFAFKNAMAETYTARSVSSEILAYYIILKDEKAIYSLLGGSSSIGKKFGAFYMLTDAILQDHAGTRKIFRFEGSDIPGISFFDEQFGSNKISYLHLKMNNLPIPFRFFK